jgi:hypothetical protein
MADRPRYPGTPRWVKVFGMIVIALVLLVAIITLAGVGGDHGPGRHTSKGDTRPSTVTEPGASLALASAATSGSLLGIYDP